MIRLRDEAWRLNAKSYPLTFKIRASFGDMDSFRHLNNVALARYLEEARAALNMQIFGVNALVSPDASLQLLVAGVVIDYVSQGRYPGQVDVATGILRVGHRSFTHAAALFQEGDCIALSDSVMVHAIDGISCPIPDLTRVLLAQHTIPRTTLPTYCV